MLPTEHLLDLPPFPDDGHAALADRLARLMGWQGDLVWVQAEAIVALEAVATSLGAPGRRAVNVVTSPYGRLFGGWLKRAGCDVCTVEPRAIGQAVDAADVAGAVAGGADLVALVHAESASGIVNPLDEIAAAARDAGALLVVDAVASFGGHLVDLSGVDVAVVGAQKALDGPAGLAAVTISERGWATMESAPTDSVLSLTDLRRDWLETGRGPVPGMPSALEWWALEAAMARVEREGLGVRQRRHAMAQGAARAALAALGLPLWVRAPEQASRLVTTAAAPPGLDMTALARATAGSIDPAVGDLGMPVLRLNHTGRRANPVPLNAAVEALANHLGMTAQNPRRLAALSATSGAWADADL